MAGTGINASEERLGRAWGGGVTRSTAACRGRRRALPCASTGAPGARQLQPGHRCGGVRGHTRDGGMERPGILREREIGGEGSWRCLFVKILQSLQLSSWKGWG